MTASRHLRRPALVAACLALGACVAPGVPSGSAPVDADFTRSAGIFSTGTTVDVALKAQERDGRLAVCGVWGPRHVTGQTRRLIKTAAATGVVQVDGRTVLMDITSFPRLPENAPFDGAEAQCLVTETTWSPGFESAKVRARFAPQRYDFDPFEDEGVRFRTAF